MFALPAVARGLLSAFNSSGGNDNVGGGGAHAADLGARAHAVEAAALTPQGFGRIVTGIPDLGAITPADAERLKQLFYEGDGLLVVRTGATTHDPQALKNFAASFGALDDNEKYYTMKLDRWLHSAEHREILCVGNARGERSMLIHVDKDDALLWHCDDSFRDPQPMGSCFYCAVAPDRSAATHFASGTAAFAALGEEEQARLRGCVAVHDYNFLNDLLREMCPGRPPLSPEVRAATPPVLRPLVAMHPVSGKEALYVPGCHISAILDLNAPAGAGPELPRGETVDRLVALTTERFSYAHQWQEGDCLVWDNRCTLHAPSHLEADTQQRLMWRLTMFGEQITPPPAELEARLAKAEARGAQA